MTDIAARNRAIKASMEQVFGRGKVRVNGQRGTGSVYVRVRIDHTPLDWAQASTLKGKLKERMREAGIDLGFAYNQCAIEFNHCRYRLTQTLSDGTIIGLRYGGDDKWELVDGEAA